MFRWEDIMMKKDFEGYDKQDIYYMHAEETNWVLANSQKYLLLLRKYLRGAVEIRTRTQLTFCGFIAYPTFVKEIEHIFFPRLRMLKLSHKCLVSIEGLGRIYMPMLEQLELSFNNICSVRNFRKFYWKFLAIIDLQHTFVNDHRFLVQAYGPSFSSLDYLGEDEDEVEVKKMLHAVIPLQSKITQFGPFSFSGGEGLDDDEED